MNTTLGVAELLGRVDQAIMAALPGPVWVRGEVSGFSRTKMGAAFFRLVDTESVDHVIEVAARGRVITDIDLSLQRAGVGALRSGIEIRARGTVALKPGRSQVQFGLLEVDPAFTVGRLAIDRAEVLRRLTADGSLTRNRSHHLPVLPLRIGLVTSRGTAAHADFIDQLRRSGFRFQVRTVQAAMQGERAPAEIAKAMRRVGEEDIDIAVLVRGGGPKLDLMTFDTEEVGRAVAAMPVPVLTGIGHETDHSIADEAAAVSEKTPSAAGEWVVRRVSDFSERVERARASIRDRAREASRRSHAGLSTVASQVGSTRTALARQRDRLTVVGVGVAEAARSGLRQGGTELAVFAEVFSAVGVEPTLRRGFALVTRSDGSPALRAASLSPGEEVTVRFADATVAMRVGEPR
jgi:exodeoxyribonuclease VII large subunit